jgi:hypothetical protein
MMTPSGKVVEGELIGAVNFSPKKFERQDFFENEAKNGNHLDRKSVV